MEISFIGAGNLAWHLAPALENAGHHINEVYSRQAQGARQLVGILYDAHTQPDLNFADSASQLFILAVPDDAIDEVCAQIVLPENAILVHTSGSKPLSLLQQLLGVYSDVPVRTGVFYALQTFSKGQPLLDFEQIPLCIEASDRDTEAQLVHLGQELSTIVYLVNSQERKVLHLAAVFACNFSNHLLALAKDLTDAENLEFDLLKPLIAETFRKAMNAKHPAEVQTGPARRGDQTIMQMHTEYLAAHQPQWLPVYQPLSESIAQRYRR
ncbi:F420-dependent NADP oxidoreductase [Nibrella saemangeumensis]|uniref:F420-dependent NADP oxidoreductase n=1 Tax=Nibrella saemangeumensis TaxID=1084526 RepID=A0ABP8NIN3_9BACT